MIVIAEVYSVIAAGAGLEHICFSARYVADALATGSYASVMDSSSAFRSSHAFIPPASTRALDDTILLESSQSWYLHWLSEPSGHRDCQSAN